MRRPLSPWERRRARIAAANREDEREGRLGLSLDGKPLQRLNLWRYLDSCPGPGRVVTKPRGLCDAAGPRYRELTQRERGLRVDSLW